MQKKSIFQINERGPDFSLNPKYRTHQARLFSFFLSFFLSFFPISPIRKLLSFCKSNLLSPTCFEKKKKKKKKKNVRAQTTSSRKDDDDDDDDDDGGAESARRTIFYRGPTKGGGHLYAQNRGNTPLFLGKTRNDCDDSVRRR